MWKWNLLPSAELKVLLNVAPYQKGDTVLLHLPSSGCIKKEEPNCNLIIVHPESCGMFVNYIDIMCCPSQLVILLWRDIYDFITLFSVCGCKNNYVNISLRPQPPQTNYYNN